MPRILDFPLDQIQISNERRPAWQILIYDINTSGDTINDIVLQTKSASPPTLGANVGPRDFTADTFSASIEEVAGDYATQGVSGTTITLSVDNPNGVFLPFNTIAAPLSDGRWLKRGNVLVIKEGDERIPIADWKTTFTGQFVGQAGTLRSRVPNAPAGLLTIKAVDRSIPFLKYENTSPEFGIGTSYLTMGTTVATGSDMGLDSDEVDLSGWGSETAAQPTQFIDEPPLVSLANLMFPSGFLPIFTGEGVLTQQQANTTALADRTYLNDDIFVDVDQPFSDISPPNSVEVIGLDGVMSKVVQETQVLSKLTLTLGYFTQDEEEDIFWSDDHTQLAQNVTARTLKSVNGGLSVLGGGETFTPIAAPSSLEGFIGMKGEFSTGFAPWLIVWLLIEYVALSWVPDVVITVGFGASSGETINVGSASAALALSAALVIMTKIGRGIYEFVGEPFEYVLKEIRGIAELGVLLSQDVIRLTIENHLCNTQALVDAAARDVLFLQQARGNPRVFTMYHDLRLLPLDIFQMVDGRNYMIDKISRMLKRGQDVVATVNAFETTAGLLP